MMAVRSPPSWKFVGPPAYMFVGPPSCMLSVHSRIYYNHNLMCVVSSSLRVLQFRNFTLKCCEFILVYAGTLLLNVVSSFPCMLSVYPRMLSINFPVCYQFILVYVVCCEFYLV